MEQNRRNAFEEANDYITGAKAARGMARGLTLLTMRRHGRFRLGVKTDTGILDPPAAAELLSMHAPASVDDLLQDEHGPSLNALVEAALKSKQGR